MTPHKTFTKTGAQVPDPKYPPTSRQMLQVWDAAWGKNQAECPPQMTPQQQKEYTQAYKTYLQVRQTLTAKVAAEAQAQQPKASNQSLIDEAQKAGLSPRTPGFPIEMPPAQTQTQPAPERKPSQPVNQPTTAKVLQNAEDLKARQNREAGDLLKAQQKERENAAAGKHSRNTADDAKYAQQKQEQAAQAQKREAEHAAKLNSIHQTTDAKVNAANRQVAVATAQVYLDSMSPEQQQKAAELYLKSEKKPYNFKDPNDTQNDPEAFRDYVKQVRDQSRGETIPVVTKPEGMPQPQEKPSDKVLPTLPMQPKKLEEQQGSFLPKVVPDVTKPVTEPAKNDPSQAKPVTSKAEEPTTDRQDQSQKAKAQKKDKKKPSSDYRKNFEDANGPIPDGHQVHHLATQASSKKSELAQRWKKLGIADVHDPENLEALPQTKEAYDKSSVKIQHSGSHPKWNEHVDETLDVTQKDLERQYGSLDKVPADVMEQTKDRVMKELREDLLDKDLGIEEGWIKHTKKGMDKLSQSQHLEEIG